MGRTDAGQPRITLGQTTVVTSVTGAEQVIVSAFANEVARRSGAGEALVLDLRLLHFEDQPTAPGGAQNRIRLAVQIQSDAGGVVEVAGSQVYLGGADGPRNYQARQEALDRLSRELFSEAVPQIIVNQEER